MSSLSAVAPHLERLFASQRIVFWHDPAREYEAELGDLSLASVNVIRVNGNEFGVKATLLADHVARHLVYRAGEIPAGTGNWLLDLELAYGVFTADRTALLQQELGLADPLFAEVIEEHEKFFAAASRKGALEKLLADGDDPTKLRAKMCQVLVKSSGHSLSDITRELLAENAIGKNAKIEELVAYGLDRFLWDGLGTIYGYRSKQPTVDDFVLWMFARAFDGFASDTLDGYRNIRADFHRLRYDVRSQDTVRSLASRAADALDIAATIAGRDFRDLSDVTIFEDVDRRVVVGLAGAVIDGSVTPREVADIVRARHDSLWWATYSKNYDAIATAAELLAAVAKLPSAIASPEVGFEHYRTDWFRIDQLYRQFTHAYQTAGFLEPLEALKVEVDKRYANTFLYGLGGLWQQVLAEVTNWTFPALTSQMAFYRTHVAPLIKDGRTKAVVIISDGMRYELADELAARLRSEDRFDASLSAMLGVLPSYTQLGMAALLPHESLRLDPESIPVYADGKPTNGTANRDEILQAVGGHAMTASDVLAMSGGELRELYKQHQIFFVYHDRIDAAGDKAATERTVFEAAEETLRELVLLVKKWTSANATNVLLTADHGFLYQDLPLEKAYYVTDRPQGEAVTKTNRRYVLGRSLKPSPSLMTFSSAQVGLDGDIDIQIPKSIHRIPQPGAGTRYVHGGASLQEIVIPVIAVNKKRKGDIRPVTVDLMPETDKITTGQLAVKLLQREAVTAKIQARRVRLGLYVGDTVISDQPVLTFDSTSGDGRERYQSAVLYLTEEADSFNGRPVELRLDEQIPNTSQWKTFARGAYTLRRSFTTDFDF
jgi:uncharacterized protein (TIGR02687 family)